MSATASGIMLSMKFADKLNALLDARRWPQQRLREFVSDKPGAATVHNWCSGKGPLPRADQALDIAKALNVDLAWLVDDSQDMPPKEPAGESPRYDMREQEILRISRLLGHDRALGRLLGMPVPGDFGPLK